MQVITRKPVETEEIKRKLVISGAIGRVVDDFNPRMEFSVFYGDTRISLGDELLAAQVQCRPSGYEHYCDAELEETFKNPQLVALVLTDPYAPGGEYLHWLIMAFLVNKKDEGAVSELPWKEVVPFEAPRPRARILIFTLFNAHEFSYIFDLSSSVPMPNSREKFSTRTFAPNNFWPMGLPISREKFSTRTFASKNALGSPLGAA